MNLASNRQVFADALSTVTDVTGYQYRPGTPNEGDAWPLWNGGDRSDGRMFLDTWLVLVFLPQDEAAASAWIDAHADLLVDALEAGVGFVERVEPVTNQQNQFLLQLSVRSD